MDQIPARGGRAGEGPPPSLLGQLSDLKYALDQAAIVAATDVHGTITFVNDKFCEISGYTREELLGANHRIINSGHHGVEFFREMYRAIAGGHVWRNDIRNRAKDGTFYWVDTTIVPFMDDQGKPYQYLAIRYDITERKRAEQTLREQVGLVQVGRLAAVVAHEVRNPLAGIRGAMQMLGRKLPEDGREQGILREVIARVDALNGIVEDLLVFARPRPLALRRVRLATLFDDLQALLRDDPKFGAVEVLIDVADAEAVVDREQLKLALVNLLQNAAQAMPDGGRIRIGSQTSGADLVIRIADEGPDIPAHAIDRLFEPFFTTKSRGTGLGLPTTRRIIELHGGSIEITCPAGGGTAATIRLPLEGPGDTESGPATSPTG